VEQDRDNAPSDDIPPVCDRCENMMERIGKMPGLGLRPACDVFRCFSCRIVLAEMTPSYQNDGPL
jgi:hypothetical protein